MTSGASTNTCYLSPKRLQFSLVCLRDTFRGIFLVPLGFSGYIWLDTKIVLKLGKKLFFFQGGSNFSRGSYFDIFPENVKYRKLLCVKLLFSCKLSKTDPLSHFGIFPEGSTTAPGSRPPLIFTLVKKKNIDGYVGEKFFFLCSANLLVYIKM